MSDALPTLFQQPGSRWWYYSWYHAGGRDRLSCRAWDLHTGIPYEEALRRLCVALGLLAPDPAPGTETLAWFRDFLTAHGDPRLAPSTWKLYLRDFGRLIELLGEDFPLRQVRQIPHVAQFQDSLRARGWAATTIDITCRSIQATFRRARQRGLIDANPFADFERLSRPSDAPVYLTDPQIEKFLSVVRAWRPMLYKKPLRYYEGLRRLAVIYLYIPYRRGEILSIRREHINLAAGTLLITNSKRRNDPLQEIVLLDIIRPEIVWFLDNFPGDTPFAIYHPDHITHYFKYWLRLAGLPDNLHLHSLRHTGASLMANDPHADLRAVQHYLGHSTIAMTEHYVHGAPRGQVRISKDFITPPQNSDAQTGHDSPKL